MPENYDWAAAALTLFRSESEDIRQLVEAAGLNAQAGDLADVDLQDLDLTDQNLSGWDLRFACLKNAKVLNANLLGSTIDPDALIQAKHWRQAKLDPELREAAERHELFSTSLQSLKLSQTAFTLLTNAKLHSIGDVATAGQAKIIRLTGITGSLLKELKSKMLDFIVSEFRVLTPSLQRAEPSEKRGSIYIVENGQVRSNETILGSISSGSSAVTAGEVLTLSNSIYNLDLHTDPSIRAYLLNVLDKRLIKFLSLDSK